MQIAVFALVYANNSRFNSRFTVFALVSQIIAGLIAGLLVAKSLLRLGVQAETGSAPYEMF